MPQRETDETVLHELLDAASRAETDFHFGVSFAGYDDQWDAYRDEKNWPQKLQASHAEYIKNLHAFYMARDGSGGVLGVA